MPEMLADMHLDLRIRYQLFLSHYNKNWHVSTYFYKTRNCKMCDNSQAVRHTHGQTYRYGKANRQFVLFVLNAVETIQNIILECI
jgi:hypothetical protein